MPSAMTSVGHKRAQVFVFDLIYYIFSPFLHQTVWDVFSGTLLVHHHQSRQSRRNLHAATNRLGTSNDNDNDNDDVIEDVMR